LADLYAQRRQWWLCCIVRWKLQQACGVVNELEILLVAQAQVAFLQCQVAALASGLGGDTVPRACLTHADRAKRRVWVRLYLHSTIALG
jgi:hypothetical protein